MAGPESSVRSGSRSISAALFWVLAAAVALRIATFLAEKRPTEKGHPTLIRWVAHEEAPATSRSVSRPILYDFTAAWCPPCHLLDREGWNDPKIAALVNRSFVPARVVDRLREEGRNRPELDALQRRFEVSAFPTLVVASPGGGQIAKFEGYRGREALVRFLEEALEKAEPLSVKR
jgi:thiol-disulfide isomerase/thioredoxin